MNNQQKKSNQGINFRIYNSGQHFDGAMDYLYRPYIDYENTSGLRPRRFTIIGGIGPGPETAEGQAAIDAISREVSDRIVRLENQQAFPPDWTSETGSTHNTDGAIDLGLEQEDPENSLLIR